MANDITAQPYCPYCLTLISESSLDHLFPQFLGGQRTIICCKKCNSTFGHTFEGEAAKILQALHVFISSWRLPLKSASATWRRAYTYDDKEFDLSVDDRGAKPDLSRPYIKYDEGGKIIRGEFPLRDKKAGDHFAQRLVEKGLAKGVSTQRVEREIPIKGTHLTINTGPDMRRTALKMCIALSTLLRDFDPEEVTEARRMLIDDPSSIPIVEAHEAYISYYPIDSRRAGLSHVVYVERNRFRVYGVVQFFGAIQLYCPLGAPKIDGAHIALLASLDPVTGNEHFSEIPPQYLPEPPLLMAIDELPRLIQFWIDKLQREAIERGAGDPGLLLSNVTP